MNETQETPERPVLTNQDLSERLQIPAQSLAVWRMKGLGPKYFKAGRHVRYRLSDVLAWEQEQMEATA